LWQVALINAAIDRARPGSRLHGLAHVSDPSDEVVEVLIKCMEWNIGSRERGLTDDDISRLQEMAVELLDLLKSNLPDKCGEKGGWNFDKTHSILHKVREIIMWGNSDNTSCQSAEHAHIDLIKSVACCTNNKDAFVCILRFHARRAYLQHYITLLQELEASEEPSGEQSEQESGASTDSYDQQCKLLKDRNFNVACETGIRYPAYEVMSCRETMFLRVSVSPILLVHGI